MPHSDLLREAQRILQLNWRDGFTVPTNKLYPFQWNWDSGFTALGWSNFSIERAIQELDKLFSGQWANGMIPHIIFHSEQEDSYFPNWDFWQASVNPGAPLSPKTSGITQPPVHGFILQAMYERFPDDERIIGLVRRLFPKIVQSHRFCYRYRDPEAEGLFFIFHPWESGRDNSPLWDESLERIQLEPGQLPVYHRKDLQLSDSAHRPTSAQYDRFVYLLELGKKYRYDEPGIFTESPFLIQDSLMNAILIKSNQALIELGRQFEFDTGELEEWQQQSVPAFREKLWNEKLGVFTAFDLRGQKQINHLEIGGLSALFAAVPDDRQAARINDYLVGLHRRGYQLTPSFDPDSPLFDSARYWRGPVWPQMNWMIYHGLRSYGYQETAEQVKESLIQLVTKLGFYEYFEPQKQLLPQLSKGYGGHDFSWTAACTADLIINGNTPNSI